MPKLRLRSNKVKTANKLATEQPEDDELLTHLSQGIAALRLITSYKPSVQKANLLTESKATPAVNIHDLTAAFTRVAQIESALANSGAEISPEIARALSNYKSLLRRFQEDLPRIHGWLLAERARLAARRSHSASVESWVRATQQTRRA